jgi:hypothetical protein
LFDVGQQSDPSLLARAAEDVILCKQLDPGFLPGAATFSPRFLTFFANTTP